MAQIQGTVDPQFSALRDLMQKHVDSGEELGTSLYINLDGHVVADLRGGYADTEKSRPWTENTITNVWSSTKTVSALATLMCVDRGLLDPYEKVSKYWPEFAANGKQDVEVRHFLSHTSGVSGWEEPISGEQVSDVDYATAKLAGQAPWWEPGTASGYHSLTMGHLLGALVKRVTGKSLTQFVREEIAGPCHADFQIGCPESEWERIAPIVPFALPDAPPQFPDGPMKKTLTNPPMDANNANTAYWRRGEVGAANGHTNAKGIGRIVSAIPLGGTVNGVKLLSPKTIDLIFREQSKGTDLVIAQPIRFGIGYGLTGDGDMVVDNLLPGGRVAFWGGWGGSMVILDVERRLTITYMMNKMSNVGLGNAAGRSYVNEVYKILGVKTAKESFGGSGGEKAPPAAG